MKTKAKPAGDDQHTVTPFLSISDAAKALDFYRKVFGAEVLVRMAEPSGKVSHAQIKIGNTRLMISDSTSDHTAEYRAKGWARDPKSLGGTPVAFYIYVDDADAVVKKAVAAGAKIRDQVAEKEWGDRIGGIEDPYGHVWYVATHLRDVPPQEVAKARGATVTA